MVDDRYMAILREQALRDSVEPKGGEEEFERSLPELKKQMKMYIARDLWDMSDFIMVFNKYDDMFNKAYELVKEKKFEKLMIK